MPTRLRSLAPWLALATLLAAASAADARTRSFCGGLATRSCGGHLEPACTSGPQCDAGHSSYSGAPFPITVPCPSVIKDERVTAGCYDERPNCGACSGDGQVPCPAAAEPWCTAGCDAGLAPDPVTQLCRAPRGPGDACGPTQPCGPETTCDPLAGFVCVARVGANESCASPFVSCEEGLQCTLALQCSHEPARLGETCDASAPCGEGLFCQAGIPQRCEARRSQGEACGPGAHCLEGLHCDAFAGFRCVAPAGPGESCLTRGCRDDLVCTARFQCSHQPGLEGETCDVVNRCAEGHFCQPVSTGITGALLGNCRAYRKPGELCTPGGVGIDACTPGTRCQLFADEDRLTSKCGVIGAGNPIPEPLCRSFYSPAMRRAAIDARATMTTGTGVEQAGGAGYATEAGVAYGQDGEYGCYYSECFGLVADLGIEAYAVQGLFTGFGAVPGFSYVAVGEAQIGGVVNFANAQVFSRNDAEDLLPRGYLGTTAALAIGTPTNPFPAAGGVLACSTNVREIALQESERGVVEPRYIPEPGALAQIGASLLGLLVLARRSARSRRRSA